MTLTLLLDLDDTLIGNDMGVFIPAYLQAFGDHLESFVSPDALVPALLQATHEMLQNNSPDRTLKQVFDSVFYPRLNLPVGLLESPIASFYVDEFPKLRRLTQFRPEAVEFVEQAAQRGYDLVLATNPLFPRTAILQRLEWAGLSAETYSFRIIPSNEEFHFAKPNPAFFAEILGRLGWPDGQFIMVGDNPHHDVEPAQEFGMATFKISEHPTSVASKYPNAHGSGSLEALLPWIDSTPADDLLLDFEHPESLKTIIRSTPAIMAAFTSDLPVEAWSAEPLEGEWSLTEIICHLRDVDGEVNLPRLEKVLDDLNPFLPGIDTDQWADQRLYYCQDGQSALSNFTKFRFELINVLENLPSDDWDLPARHAIFGPTHLRELVRIIANHDRLHIRQAYQALGEIAKVSGD